MDLPFWSLPKDHGHGWGCEQRFSGIEGLLFWLSSLFTITGWNWQTDLQYCRGFPESFNVPICFSLSHKEDPKMALGKGSSTLIFLGTRLFAFSDTCRLVGQTPRFLSSTLARVKRWPLFCSLQGGSALVPSALMVILMFKLVVSQSPLMSLSRMIKSPCYNPFPGTPIRCVLCCMSVCSKHQFPNVKVQGSCHIYPLRWTPTYWQKVI